MGMESRLPRTPAGQTKSKNSQIWKDFWETFLMEVLLLVSSKNLNFYDEYIDYIYIYMHIIHLHHCTSYIVSISSDFGKGRGLESDVFFFRDIFFRSFMFFSGMKISK